MSEQLPGPRPCTMCRSENDQRVKVLITAKRGEIELSSRKIPAAVYECKLCGAVRMEPLQPIVVAAAA